MISVEIRYLYRGIEKKKFMTIEDIMVMIRSGKYAKSVQNLRDTLDILRQEGMTPDSDDGRTLPYIIWGNGKDGYSGLVMLSLPCSDRRVLEATRQKVRLSPNVVCAFTGASGKTLKVIMAYESTNGITDSGMFHANAYCRAVQYMLAMTGIESTGEGGRTDSGCHISADSECYYNADAVALRMEMPTRMPDDDLCRTGNITPLMAKVSTVPGYTKLEHDVTTFNLIRRELQIDDEGDDATELISVAEACARAGIEEEVAVKCALRMSRFEGKTLLVRTTFGEAYKNRTGKTVSKIPKSAILITMMKQAVASRYRFRRNELTDSMEFMEINRYIARWQPYTPEVRNTICMELRETGIDVWDKDIDRYVHSTLTQDYDPIAVWLDSLPDWDGRDRVAELAATVPTEWEMWQEMFAIWMRALVSQWRGINGMYGATMVMMLTGEQGTRKSTFCRRLMPPELMPYYTDRLDFTNKRDAERALTRFCLINLDEFDQISQRQTAFLKHMLQKSSVAYRKMYQNEIEQTRRYAAFCATTNSNTPLTDPTGSRRYMVVEVTGAIDTTYEIDHAQLYAQVLAEVHAGKVSFFDSQKEHCIMEHNISYTEETPLETMFNNTFAPAREGEEYIELTTTEILLELKKRYASSIIINRSTITRMGQWLNSQGIKPVRKEKRRVYRLRHV